MSKDMLGAKMTDGLIGFFDYPGQEAPTYDPPHVCLICGQPLTDPVKTISLLSPDDPLPRSYFYRAHAICYEENPANCDAVALNIIERAEQEPQEKL